MAHADNNTPSLYCRKCGYDLRGRWGNVIVLYPTDVWNAAGGGGATGDQSQERVADLRLVSDTTTLHSPIGR